jgi:hypothetical protein
MANKKTAPGAGTSKDGMDKIDRAHRSTEKEKNQ